MSIDDIQALGHQLVNELPVECPNKEAGCEEKPQRQLLELHLRDACKHTDPTEDEETSSGSERKQVKGTDDVRDFRASILLHR